MKTSVGLKAIENPAECREQLRLIREAGFDAIDINLATDGARQVMNAPDAAKKADEIRTWIADAGLEIGQGHAPFNPYVYGNPEKGNAVIRDIHACFPFAARLGVRDLVVHPMRPRDTTDPFFLNPAELIDKNIEMLSAMVREAAPGGLTLCIENLFSVTPEGKSVHGYTSKADELNALMDAVPGLCICLDSGHAFITDTNPADLARAFGSRLRLLHLHGNNRKNDLHVSPFEMAQQPWEELCRALAEIGYAGNLNLETMRFTDLTPAPLLPEAYRYLHACAACLVGLIEKYRA